MDSVALLSHDFRYMMDEFEIPEQVKALIADAAYKTLSTFTVLADDRAGVRAALIQDFVNPAEAHLTVLQVAQARLIVNKLIAAWVVGHQRVVDEVRVGADARALRLPVLLNRSALISLRQRFETEYERINDSVWPCAALIEKRLEEVEEGSFSATPLSEIISVSASVDEQVVIQEAGTNIRVRKQPKDIALPTTTEELRTRFKTLAITFILAKYKHGSRLWLQTTTLELWNKYVEHLLSDKIALYHLDREGCSIRATWTTVLAYDLAMRRLACRCVLYDGMDIATALTFAMKDLECKEINFITPTALISSNRGGSSSSTSNSQALQTSGQQKGSEKGAAAKKRKFEEQAGGKGKKGSGKGSKGNKGGKVTRTRKTPDGRLICDFFNKGPGCTKGEACKFVHVCNFCLAPGHGAASGQCQ